MDKEIDVSKEFVIPTLSLRMKRIGFDKPCLRFYWQNKVMGDYGTPKSNSDLIHLSKTELKGLQGKSYCSAPTWQSAFEWFREKYNCHSHPTKYDETKWWVGYGTWTSPVFDSFYEAQMCWLERIIELAEIIESEKKIWI